MFPKTSVMKGFTLLEALAALVVLSLVFSAVFSWVAVATRATTNIEQSIALPDAFEQYLDYLQLESLQDKAAGQVEIDGFLFDWRASINRRSDQELYRRQPSRLVTLYDIEIQVRRGQDIVTELATKVVRQGPDHNYKRPPGLF